MRQTGAPSSSPAPPPDVAANGCCHTLSSAHLCFLFTLCFPYTSRTLRPFTRVASASASSLVDTFVPSAPLRSLHSRSLVCSARRSFTSQPQRPRSLELRPLLQEDHSRSAIMRSSSSLTALVTLLPTILAVPVSRRDVTLSPALAPVYAHQAQFAVAVRTSSLPFDKIIAFGDDFTDDGSGTWPLSSRIHPKTLC